METDELISLKDFCTHHSIEFSFIDMLNEFGMIEIVSVEQNQFIRAEQMKNIERIIRLHYELNINMEGIDAIMHLLQRINSLHDELINLKNKQDNY